MWYGDTLCQTTLPLFSSLIEVDENTRKSMRIDCNQAKIGDQSNLSIAKNHLKPSQKFTEQVGPSIHKMKRGFSGNSPQKIHPNFAWEKCLWGNIFSGLQKNLDKMAKPRRHMKEGPPHDRHWPELCSVTHGLRDTPSTHPLDHTPFFGHLYSNQLLSFEDFK